ncbi:hypothetical protein B9Z55_016572 [Caenorhabditis nigoni]|uniref:Serpentine receptor class gamma n=1 Tax=Caenorhabditis nigoni TaxID=1611254 RepID=A0A2G5T5Q0_9PELO|nr:hypothetical protein B9Z55_016572 [Caenorhabditis nigoni]
MIIPYLPTTTEKVNNFHFVTWRLFDPLYLLFVIPVTIHYILVLKAVSNFRESNSFLYIFAILGVFDVVYCFAMLGCELLHYTQFLSPFGFVCCVVLSYYGVFFNLLSNGLLSVNRLCATCVWYNTYFSDSCIKVYFYIISIISLICTLPGGVLMFIYLFKDYGLAAQYGKTGLESFNTHRTIIITMMISDGIVGCVTSLSTMYRLRKYKISYDKSLLLVTTLHIFPDAFVSMFNLDMIFQYTGDSQYMNELSRMFLVFLVSFNSLTIVCTNRQIRQEYFRLLFFWKTICSSYCILIGSRRTRSASSCSLFFFFSRMLRATTKAPALPVNNFHFETWRLFNPFYLLFYCIPVTFHYFLVLIVIRKTKRSSGFFLIFYLAGISDVVYCLSMLSSEFIHYTQLLPRFIFVCFVVISYYGVFFNHLANILLSANRFSATCVWYNNSRVFLIFLVSFNSLTIVATNRKIRREYLQIFAFWKESESVVGTASVRKRSTTMATPGMGRVTVF